MDTGKYIVEKIIEIKFTEQDKAYYILLNYYIYFLSVFIDEKKLKFNGKDSTNKYEDFTNNTQVSILLTVRDIYLEYYISIYIKTK